MMAWIRNCFRDAHAAHASVMAIAGSVGMVCCLGVILIVLLAR